MNTYRYFKWDGTEPFALDQEKLMDELSRKLMADGDLSFALWEMQNMGMRDGKGRRLPSLDDLLRRLQERKQRQLNKYKLDSVMDDIRKALDEVIKTERGGIQRQLSEVRQRAQQDDAELTEQMKQKLLKSIEDRAAENLRKLDNLPPDVGGQIKELSQYDFTDQEARAKFQELMDMLKKRAMDSYARDLGQKLQSLDPEALSDLRKMLQALNQMLEQRMQGNEPDFESFMKQFGHYFGPNPPQSLDELMERLQDQIAQARSLLDSLSQEQRESLEKILNSVLDGETQNELARLGANLQLLHPGDRLRKQYPFSGDESLSYSEALKLMEMLQKMDKLERQLTDSRYSRSLESVDRKAVRELLGDEAAEELEALRNITKLLEEAGYIRREGGKYELTPRGMRKIGEKALSSVFAKLRKDRRGEHKVLRQGSGGERIDDTKQYEFGDNFDLHIEKTLMNALFRRPQTPVKLEARDFEVFKEEQVARSATVLMLDLSLSMPMYGNFQAAKIVAVALDALISSQYPKDSLYIVGFSSYARRMTKEDLTYISWDDFDPYTNMQHGFVLARKLLDRDRSPNKQIILISDGEPTAHFEHDHVFFQYPPSLRTIQLTLKEVSNCTRKGIIINTFMLRRSGFLSAFVTQMARLNRGRVFFTTADSLGQYLIVDYISNKKRRVS